MPTLFSGRQNVSSADYDTSDYVARGSGIGDCGRFHLPQVKEEEELEEAKSMQRARVVCEVLAPLVNMKNSVSQGGSGGQACQGQ